MQSRTGIRWTHTAAHKDAVYRSASCTLNRSCGPCIPGTVLKLATTDKTHPPRHMTGGVAGWLMAVDMLVHMLVLRMMSRHAAAAGSSGMAGSRSSVPSGAMQMMIGSSVLRLLQLMPMELVRAGCCVLLTPAANSETLEFLNTETHTPSVSEHNTTTQSHLAADSNRLPRITQLSSGGSKLNQILSLNSMLSHPTVFVLLFCNVYSTSVILMQGFILTGIAALQQVQ